MAMMFNRAYPVFFVLMEQKTKGAYDQVLQKLVELAPELHPQVIVSDFETALQTALRERFADAHILGCFFHSSTAMWRKARSLGLTRALNINPAVKRAVKMTMALALLPETQIEEGFPYIVTYVQANGLEPILNQYMAYVRRTWIQGVGGQHLSVFGQPRRINNDQESFHNQLLQRFSHVHQNVWRFLEELRNIEHAYVQQYATYENGVANDAVPAPSYLSNNRRIQDATSLLLARRYNAGEFLRRVSNVVPTPRNNNLTVEDEEEEVAAPPNEGLPPLPVALPPGMRQIENMHEMPTDNEDEDDLHIIVQAPVRRGGRGRGRGGGRGRVQGISRIFRSYGKENQTSIRPSVCQVSRFSSRITPNGIIMTDFKMVLQTALRERFADANIFGCFFPSSPAMWRKASRIGPDKSDQLQPIRKKNCKNDHVSGVATVPDDKIDQGFEYIPVYVQANVMQPILGQYMKYVRREPARDVTGASNTEPM